jgi:hypothetical protein
MRIPSEKGHPDFFSSVKGKLVKMQQLQMLEASAVTGTVLMVADRIDIEAVAEFAEEEGLFRLRTTQHEPVPLSHRIAEHVRDVSGWVHRLTGGEADLAGMAFVALLGVGLYEIMRGNFKTPPWYTAFWYALGVFTKSVADKTRLDF